MKRILVLLLFSISILISSCSQNTITAEAFYKIDYGMSQTEVKNILGDPFEIRYSADSLQTYYYRVKRGLDLINVYLKFDKNGYVGDISPILGS